MQAGKFGWARVQDGRSGLGRDMSSLADSVVADLSDAGKLALGFECPLFVPLREDPHALTRARAGEGNRSWSAAAGIGSLGVGLVQIPWILTTVRDRARRVPAFFTDWHAFAEAPGGVFFWEAFVSGSAKARAANEAAHALDAELAAQAFADSLPDPTRVNAVSETNVFSMLGAALLRAGWADATTLLGQPCLVIRVGAARDSS